MAAYIDLNPVRAGLTDDPKDYRWCGYAAALGGDELARAGLMSILQAKDWKTAAAEYRKYLFVAAGRAGRSEKTVLDREQILKVLKEGGELSLPEILRLRIAVLQSPTRCLDHSQQPREADARRGRLVKVALLDTNVLFALAWPSHTRLVCRSLEEGLGPPAPSRNSALSDSLQIRLHRRRRRTARSRCAIKT